MNVLLLEKCKESNSLTIESFIALTLWKFLDAESQMAVKLVERHVVTSIPIKNADKFSIIDEKSAKLPMLKINNGTYNIIGLCSVLRGICRVMQPKNAAMATQLLGFKENCLLSASTTSLWVSFCELDIVECLATLMTSIGTVDFPLAMLKLEMEFRNPVRMHNIFKTIRESRQDQSIKSHNAFDVDMEHRFCHGNEANLSDFVLYVLFKLIFITISADCEGNVPRVMKWHRRMEEEFGELKGTVMELVGDLPVRDFEFNAELPVVEANGKYFSLFKRQLMGHKMKKFKSLTNQSEIDGILEKLTELKVKIESQPGEETNKINDKTVEELLSSGEFPETRLDRKKSQLKSFVSEVILIAKDGDTIVDFCSGTGHVGLLIALLLPQCRVVILENKEESIKRAKLKAEKLQLNNVIYFQCNLEYFNENFDLGVSLHACGIATDLVLQKCYQMRANFVSSPCCYGKIQDLGNLPQSRLFRATLNANELIMISHCADQTHDERNVKHINLEKAKQGYFCMDVIDTDRSLRAQELGYQVKLKRLFPEDCTLKNRLLIGFYDGNL